MNKRTSSKLPASIEGIQEESLNEETAEGKEEMSSKGRLQKKMLEIQAELLALLKRKEKINHQVILHKIDYLKHRPPFQDHSDHMDPHHLTQDP
ncbi:hypothetical protein O181_080672 [Austropuccinia psidii MF-1]|uniref:Uncharacterized protein n=1 Tax=Austropuccinia psidii MF-1 TaxID=1389203 RepID=A0A9Q3IHN2_9BASI|nr:hypothetical protein [Austropuccinia psidii MF-1]